MRKPILLAVVLTAAVAAAACSESSPVAPGKQPEVLARLTCYTDVAARSTRCVPSSPDLPSGVRATAVIMGQDSAYAVQSAGDVYDEVTETYTATMKVRNLLASPIGTADGTTQHADGIRVFLSAGPSVWLGSGTVTASNADGTGTFTAANQPYWQYNEILTQNQYSSPKAWEFHVPTSVQGWYYEVLIWAHVP